MISTSFLLKTFVFLLLWTNFLFSTVCLAQDLTYAKEVIRNLCDESMKGRGYVENGDKSAAAYIATEFEKAGLKKYSKTYFQHFTTPVNSFPGEMTLFINGKKLKPGEDFLIDPGSPGISGKFSVVSFNADDLLKNEVWISKMKSAASKFIIVEAFDKTKYNSEQVKQLNEIISFLKYSKENPAQGTIIMTTDKLTWSGSTELYSTPSFMVKLESATEEIKSIEVSAENKFLKNHQTQNVIGYIEGTNKDSLLVFTAHYDHLGMMGKETMFPGANDNASGVSMLLNLVKHYAAQKPKYTMVFIAFAAEEIGLVGSTYFTEHPVFPLKKIKFLINFDLAGTGDDGIQVVNGKVYQQKFDQISKLNEEGMLLKQVKIRGEACNSDHCMFHSKGVPCFFIYTLGGIQAYHDIYDRPETLPLTEYEDYFTLLVKFIQTL
ncbi:M28 family peptidase [Chryseolinea sp. H1M3-3]|uniref:M28 family metallopeptidase n=1 Tax=Chryseolinea sp. H1M3-3 TaxID=3034144 RepID=UPI0023EE064C|nr:M28 family peptidase [Chryseolinea sp. H1M3-3]